VKKAKVEKKKRKKKEEEPLKVRMILKMVNDD